MEHPYKTPEADLAEEKLTAEVSFPAGSRCEGILAVLRCGFLLLSVAARQAMVAIVDPR